MRAAILTAHNEPLELREIEWAPLRCGQVLVKILTSGICGAQLAEIRGDKNGSAPIPRLLGHEACGVVHDIGEGVATVRKGDRVVCHWRKGNGVESQFPMWIQTIPHQPSGVFKSAGLITTFATHSVISENRLTSVPSDTPEGLCALLGCGLSTALGVIENEANPKIGESVLIIGCGGLGLNLILAAKLRGCGEIAVCDIHDKEGVAKEVGADYFWQIDHRGICYHATSYLPPIKFDAMIDTTGDNQAIAHGIECLAPSGRFILVGQPKPGKDVTIPNARNLFAGDGCRIIATQGGRFSPSRDIPRYVAAWRAGRINLDGIVSHRLPLSKINEGLDLVRSGHAGRVLIDCTK
jgi:S-(hydroxymethyl)glutathione dehydrogenase/alcohol dehydrogenase